MYSTWGCCIFLLVWLCLADALMVTLPARLGLSDWKQLTLLQSLMTWNTHNAPCYQRPCWGITMVHSHTMMQRMVMMSSHQSCFLHNWGPLTWPMHQVTSLRTPANFNVISFYVWLGYWCCQLINGNIKAVLEFVFGFSHLHFSIVKLFIPRTNQ